MRFGFQDVPVMIVRERAVAKVNLYLHVTGRRADGYHLLDSLIGFADAADVLEAVPAEQLSLAVEGPYAAALAGQDNIVLRAANMLRVRAGTTAGAAITLHKHLPVAAGIGGGSADAAAALRLLMRLWNPGVSEKDLLNMALALGADVPACLRSSPLYMSGIGEILAKGPSLAGMALVLVNPAIALKTQDVFARYAPPFSTPARHPQEFASPTACAGFLSRCRNDLEEPAIGCVPQIRTVLNALSQAEGCLLARMSGSGATCYGLFADIPSAAAAEAALDRAHTGWWIKAARLC